MPTTKTFDDADFSTTTRRRTTSKKHRGKITREERADIRFLHSRGVPQKDIITKIGRARSSISATIRNLRVPPDNIEEDYKYISNKLLQVERTQTPFENPPKAKPLVSSLNAEYVDSGSEDDADSGVPLKVPAKRGAHGGCVQQKPKRTIRPGVSESTKKRWELSLPPSCNTDAAPISNLVKTPVKEEVNKNDKGRTVVLTFLKNLEQHLNKPEADDIVVLNFLKGLDQDLSRYYPELKEKELGTAAKLFLFAKKEYAEELPQLIKDTLPDIPPAHRYILLKGLKDYDKTHHSKGCHRI